MPPNFEEAIILHRRLNEAEEKIRVSQQGEGRGIISLLDHGYRMVAVGNTMFYGKNWNVFPDFLLYFLRVTLGETWVQQGIQKPGNKHPFFGWVAKHVAFLARTKTGDGLIKVTVMPGFLAAIMHLAYALYLIRHHDHIPQKLLSRLKRSEGFRPAYYETLVGAAFAVAGFSISNAEDTKTNRATPEFYAKSAKSGKIYAVEAKCKFAWTADFDPDADDFQNELRQWIRDQLYKASRKKLENPVFWFELSIGASLSATEWKTTAAIVIAAIREAETSLLIDSKIPAPAYIFITNYSFLVNEDTESTPMLAYMDAFHISDFLRPGHSDIETALLNHHRHRDITRVMEFLKTASTIPTTFDGTPEELLSAVGETVRPIRIGDRYLYPDGQGNEKPGLIEDLVRADDHVLAIVRDEASGGRVMVRVPLTQAEILASEKYGNAVFGNPNGGALKAGDIIGLYEWLLETNSRITREQILKNVTTHPSKADFNDNSIDDLRARYCRALAKSIYVDSQNKRKSGA